MVLSFREARACVVEKLRAAAVVCGVERAALEEAAGRVLAEEALADRDYPPLDRSLRDGFAVRAAELPGELRVVGEVRAGQHDALCVGAGEAVEIMTGAPLPAGADAVLMVEDAECADGRVRNGRRAVPGVFVNPRGTEARAGRDWWRRERALDFAHVNCWR